MFMHNDFNNCILSKIFIKELLYVDDKIDD